MKTTFCTKNMLFSKKKKSLLGISLIFFNFPPKIKVFFKKKEKKRSSPKFGNYFLQLIMVNVLKFLTLPKFFISLPKKFWFCPNICLSLPKKFEFCPNFVNLPYPPGMAMAVTVKQKISSCLSLSYQQSVFLLRL